MLACVIICVHICAYATKVYMYTTEKMMDQESSSQLDLRTGWWFQGHPVLKTIWLRQLGWWQQPNISGKMPNSWQPNHQPANNSRQPPQFKLPGTAACGNTAMFPGLPGRPKCHRVLLNGPDIHGTGREFWMAVAVVCYPSCRWDSPGWLCDWIPVASDYLRCSSRLHVR